MPAVSTTRPTATPARVRRSPAPRALTAGVKDRMAELEREWATLKARVTTFETTDVEAFNQLLERAGVPGLISKTPKPKVVM